MTTTPWPVPSMPAPGDVAVPPFGGVTVTVVPSWRAVMAMKPE